MDTYIMSHLLSRESSIDYPKDQLLTVNFRELKVYFETQLIDILFSQDLLSPDIFPCSLYVANLLSNVSKNMPASWFVFDYIELFLKNRNIQTLKQGADISFLICSVWPGRGNHRCMKIKDYEDMGQAIYSKLHSLTHHQIHQQMACFFQTMVEVTKKCIQEL